MRAGDTEERQDLDTKMEADPAKPLALTIDWELYLRHLEDSDASEAEKRALIECLWSIVVSFVDMGFHLSPLQESCGQIEPLSVAGDHGGQSMLSLNHTPIQQAFDGAADHSVVASPERSLRHVALDKQHE